MVAPRSSRRDEPTRELRGDKGGRGSKGGSCHEVTIVNFRFHESPRSRKKSYHNAVKFSYELNFRHSRFISCLFTIHSQGLLHFTPHGIHFNHDSRNTEFFFYQITIHRAQKNRITASRKYPCPTSIELSIQLSCIFGSIWRYQVEIS